MKDILEKKSTKQRLLAPSAGPYLSKQHDDGKQKRGRKRCSMGAGGADRECTLVDTISLFTSAYHIGLLLNQHIRPVKGLFLLHQTAQGFLLRLILKGCPSLLFTLLSWGTFLCTVKLQAKESYSTFLLAWLLGM